MEGKTVRLFINAEIIEKHHLYSFGNRGYMEHVIDYIRSGIRFKSEDRYDIYILHSDLKERDRIYLAAQIEDSNSLLHFRFV